MPTTKRIKLSYRESAVGGEVKTIPFVSDTAALAAAQHIVLLIHGYNNDTEAAQEAYEGFHRRQGELDAVTARVTERSPAAVGARSRSCAAPEYHAASGCASPPGR